MIRFIAKDKALQSKLDDFVDRQVPFALSDALSNALTKTRDNELRRSYKSTFKMRDKQFFKLTHSVARADISFTKRTGTAIAAIKRADAPRIAGTVGGTTRKPVDTSFMEAHVKGSRRRALRTKKAVPLTKGRTPVLGITRTKTGKVTKARKASTLYNKEGSFVVGNRSHDSILMVRTGKTTIRAAYLLTPSVKNEKKYGPLIAVQRGMRTRMKQEFQKSIFKAVRTSRRPMQI